MALSDRADLDRRRFLKLTGLMAAGLLDGCGPTAIKPAESSVGESRGFRVALVRDPADSVAMAPSARWAAESLQSEIEAQGVRTRFVPNVGGTGTAELAVIVTSSQTSIARGILDQAGLKSPQGPESLALVPQTLEGKQVLLAAAPDARGLVYALTELADRVAHGADPLQSLRLPRPIVERPVNRIRSVLRMFVSDVEDKSWFNDRAFWPKYFAMLVGQRFNRFNLSLSLGYDAPQHLRDTYFYFPYPFLLDVPGYHVRAAQLSDAERDQNLQSLRYIGQQAAAHGLDFQLGLWTHAYHWQDSPNANYVIDGLTPATQAPYCRDALKMLLAACPQINGLTFRTHGESGVAEGSYDFWRTLFSAISGAGRPINIDLHAKGITQEMIDIALAASPTVTVSPKFWAEHMGLPYLQSSIREEEMPREHANNSFFSLSNGTRSFLRYSYGDLFRTDRKYGILHRVWPGTQRLLLWGDPAFAAGYGRIFNQCGADGVEYFDPLSFKGRKGSGLPGGRDGYADTSLRDEAGDWSKYLYSYRLWGRLSYNPACEPEVWKRSLASDFGPAAGAVESLLAASSRILPLITSSHDPSAANANYWPEMYLNMSVVDGSHPGSYTDTPRPRVFGTVSSLDPAIFSTCDECAAELLGGPGLAKYTPLDVADRLADWARSCAQNLSASRSLIADAANPAYRRVMIDAQIAAGIGRFFALKFKAAVLYAVFDRCGSEPIRTAALQNYRAAAAAWKELAAVAEGVYVHDLTFGPDPQLRGHWQDRLAAIEKDIVAMQSSPAANPGAGIHLALQGSIIARMNAVHRKDRAGIRHAPPASFTRGRPISLTLRDPANALRSARLFYRQMNQATRYQWQEMQAEEQAFSAVIPAEYTNSPYPMQYYFELDSSALFPGLGPDYMNQPYFIIQPR